MSEYLDQFDQHVAAVERIDKAADGRALTGPQKIDRDHHIDGAVRMLVAEESAATHAGGGNSMVRMAAERAATASDDAAKLNWLTQGRRAVRAQQLATEGAAARGETRPRVEGPTGPAGADPIRQMILSGETRYDWDFARALNDTRAIADFSDGNSLYVNDFSTQVAYYARTASPLLAVATVVNSDNGRPMVVPTLTADGTVYTPGEGTAITESSATLGTALVTPIAYKALEYVSAEAIEDVEYPLAQLLARSAARAIGLQAGTAMSAVVLSGASNGGTALGLGGGSTATFLGLEDLYDLEFSRSAPYRLNASWLMANGAMKKVRKFTTTTGQYLWQPSIQAGQPDVFEGRPVYEDPGLAAPASATKSVLYGDFAAGVVIKMTQLRVEISRDFRFSNDQVALKVVGRMAAAVQDSNAIAYIVSKNT